MVTYRMFHRLRRIIPATAAALLLIGMSSGAYAADGSASGGKSTLVWIFTSLDILVIAVLAGASIWGVALIIDALLNIKESKIAPVETTEHLRSLINARQFKELLEFTSGDQSFVSQALNAGLRRAHLGYASMRDAMETAIGEQTAGYFRRIEMLNVIGNIGPLIGLLGTVLGMIIAFYTMQEKGGQPKPQDLAGGIATALWHTFGGLLVAIPCLVFFGLIRTRTDRITTKAATVAEDLLESLRPAEKAAPAARRAPAAAPAPAATPENG